MRAIEKARRKANWNNFTTKVKNIFTIRKRIKEKERQRKDLIEFFKSQGSNPIER